MADDNDENFDNHQSRKSEEENLYKNKTFGASRRGSVTSNEPNKLQREFTEEGIAVIPGPGAYEADSNLVKKNNFSYSLGAKKKWNPDDGIPSPTSYTLNRELENKRQAVSFKARGAVSFARNISGPGVGKYNVEKKIGTQPISFGVKHQEFSNPTPPATFFPLEETGLKYSFGAKNELKDFQKPGPADHAVNVECVLRKAPRTLMGTGPQSMPTPEHPSPGPLGYSLGTTIISDGRHAMPFSGRPKSKPPVYDEPSPLHYDQKAPNLRPIPPGSTIHARPLDPLLVPHPTPTSYNTDKTNHLKHAPVAIMAARSKPSYPDSLFYPHALIDSPAPHAFDDKITITSVLTASLKGRTRIPSDSTPSPFEYKVSTSLMEKHAPSFSFGAQLSSSLPEGPGPIYNVRGDLEARSHRMGEKLATPAMFPDTPSPGPKYFPSVSPIKTSASNYKFATKDRSKGFWNTSNLL